MYSVLIPFLNEAILTLERGVATVEDIDKTFMLGVFPSSSSAFARDSTLTVHPLFTLICRYGASDGTS